jgi:hypothetical protein
MLVPAIVILSGLLSSAVAGPHARLKSPKPRPKKIGLMEVLSSSSSNSTFSTVSVAPKTNIFISLTNDEAVGSFFFPHHAPSDSRRDSQRPQSSASSTTRPS